MTGGPRPALSRGTPLIGGRAVYAAYFAFVCLIPLETIDVFGKSTDSFFTFSSMLGLILCGLAVINWRACFRTIPSAFWLIGCYLAVYALSQLRIPVNLDAQFLGNQKTLIQMAVLFLISANLFEDADFRAELLRFYGWWVGLVAVGMLLGAFGEASIESEGRRTILGQDPNVAAGFFALGAVCIAGDAWIFASRRFAGRLALALLAVGALIMAILETGSRGGLLVFVAGILGLAVCGGRASRMNRLSLAGAVIVVLGVMVFREFQQGTTTASRLMDTWTQGDTAGRTKIYAMAWTMFLERPLLGYGGANNFFTLGAHLNDVLGHVYVIDTHNLLLALLTEVGLVGAVPFIAAMFYALWTAWRHGRRTDDGLPFALMCAQITMNCSLTGLHQKLFWIVFAAAVACGAKRRPARP